MDLKIASALTNIGSKYENKILNLIKIASSKFNDKENYYEYLKYILRLVELYYSNLIKYEYLYDLSNLKSRIMDFKDSKAYLSLSFSLDKIIRLALSERAKNKSFKSCTIYLNKCLEEKKLITTPGDLFDVVTEITESDLKKLGRK